jgi:hypothetical protein
MKEMQIKATLPSFQSILPSYIMHTTTKAGEDVGGKEHFHTVGGNVNLCTCYGKQYGGLLKKLKIKLPYDPVIPLFGIHPQDCALGYDRAICTPMLSAALFTIAKLWKQPDDP